MNNIMEILRHLGVGGNYAGQKLTASAVEQVTKDSEKLLMVTKALYPVVAHNFNCSVYAVERNIRTAAKIAWQRNPELLNEIAGYKLAAPPSAAQFIDIIYTYTYKKEREK